jgi:MoaA/NifB/PqqE/SkfB family radical SAM enzyme
MNDGASPRRLRPDRDQTAEVLAGMRTGVPATGPLHVHIDVTNACNAACVTCWDHSPLLTQPRPLAWKGRTLAKGNFDSLIDQLDGLASVRGVVISGMGEPLTHPDIYDMLRAVKARGWHVTLMTNLVAANLDELVACQPDSVLVGVQGVTPRTHAAFHPGWTSDHFFRMCGGLRALARAGATVRHVQVINRDTAAEVPAMVRFARLYSADRVNFKLASLSGGTEGCAITEEQRTQLLAADIPEARRLSATLGVRTNLDLFEAHHRRRRCAVLLQHGGEGREPPRGAVRRPVARAEMGAPAANVGRRPLPQRLRAVREVRTEQEVARSAGCDGRSSVTGERAHSVRTLATPAVSRGRPTATFAQASRRPTVEWQVAGACNYDCSYCIQSPTYRRGRPDKEQLERAVESFAGLPGEWELKLSGGEAFAHPLFLDFLVPALMERTPHRISVLTNFSASRAELQRFAAITRARLAVFSASLHLEFADPAAFVEKAAWLVGIVGPEVAFVVNQVVRPDRMPEAARCKDLVESAGLRWFPQLFKTGGGVATYPDEAALRALIGDSPGPREANLAPSYRGRMCWSGVDYFTVDKDGAAWSCRTAKRHKRGSLGNVYAGTLQRLASASPCPYGICPCTVPANRGMVEGVGN